MRQFTRNARMTYLACGLVSIAMGLGLGASPALAGKSSTSTTITGQSAMVYTEVPGKATVITDNVQWDFDSVTAYATYSNLCVAGSGTYKSCSGSSTNCASTNMPSTPSAPAPDVSQFNRQFEDSIVCATFYGATAMPSKTYYQTVTVNGNNGRGNFTF